jgi:hypothetical protein
MKKLFLAALVLGGSLTMTSCGGGDEAKVRELAKMTCEMRSLSKQMKDEQDPEKQKAIEAKLKDMQTKGEPIFKSLEEKMKADSTFAKKADEIMKAEMEKCQAAK